jgi:hypothetical protein
MKLKSSCPTLQWYQKISEARISEIGQQSNPFGIHVHFYKFGKLVICFQSPKQTTKIQIRIAIGEL